MLSERIALVTGASRGIGRAIAIALATEGARVIINYKGNEKAAQEVEELISQKGARAQLMPADVSSSEQVQEMMERILKEYGRLDILVNNAGINRDTLLMRMKDEDWSQVIQTNLTSAFYCMKATVRTMMKQRYGKIINIASVVGLHGNAGQVNYAAAKAGIIGLTKSAAKELASRGITVNAVAPGFIETDMTGRLPFEVQEKIITGIPLSRLGKPEDVAKLVLFLAGPGADYLTGQVISVDGGMSM